MHNLSAWKFFHWHFSYSTTGRKLIKYINFSNDTKVVNNIQIWSSFKCCFIVFYFRLKTRQNLHTCTYKNKFILTIWNNIYKYELNIELFLATANHYCFNKLWKTTFDEYVLLFYSFYCLSFFYFEQEEGPSHGSEN